MLNRRWATRMLFAMSITAISAAGVLGEVSPVPAHLSPRMGAERSSAAAGDRSREDAAGPGPHGAGVLCQEPSGQCQPASLLNAWRSDGQGLIAADDFRPVPLQGPLTSVCWWGTYGAEEITEDAFVITYYDGATGKPGAELASFSQADGSLIVNGPTATGRVRASLTEYEYVGTQAPVDLQTGHCYWIEIRNDVPENKRWYWSTAESGGSANGRAIQDGQPLNGYDSGDIVDDDLAFCLNVVLVQTVPCLQYACCLPGDPCRTCVELSSTECLLQGGAIVGASCGSVVCDVAVCGACCLGAGACEQLLSDDCQTAGGSYFGDAVFCSSNPCPDTPVPCCMPDGSCDVVPQQDCSTMGGIPRPSETSCAESACNDDCSAAMPVASDSVVIADTRYATTDASGPTFGCQWNAPPEVQGENSLWYRFQATSRVIGITVRNVEPGDEFADSIVALYESVPSGGCSDLVEVACSEDDAGGTTLASRILFDGLVVGDVYYVQVANAGGPVGYEPGVFELTLIDGCMPDETCCRGDLNVDGAVNGSDIGEFVYAVLNSVDCGTADFCRGDVNGDLWLDNGDVEGFVGLLLAGAPCAANDCADALAVTGNTVPFSTIGTNTDGAELPPVCDEGFGVGFENDAWFCYTTTCDGALTISTCGTTDFDVRLAVYVGCSCPPSEGDLLACSDDAAGCGDFGAEVSFGTLANQQYLIRVGGFEGAVGAGVLTMSCDATGDTNCDGAIGEDDIEAFVTALLDPATYALFHPDCGIGVADTNGDGSVNGLDVQAFIALFLGG